MSPIGRIFSVLNLVLAVWFLAWAVQTAAKNEDFQGRWNEETTAHTRTRTDLEDQVRRVRAELQTAESNAATLRDQLEQERNRATRLEGELASARNDSNTQRDIAQRLSESYDAMMAQLESANQEKDRAFEARVAAERDRDASRKDADQAQSTLADAQSQIRQLRESMEDGQTTEAQLERQVRDLETDLDTLVAVTGVPRSGIQSQPQIEASVIQVNYDIEPGMIALNAGADKGVKRGHTFELYSGSQYKGQARVENVHENISTALIVRAVNGARITQGDRATTRL